MRVDFFATIRLKTKETSIEIEPKKSLRLVFDELWKRYGEDLKGGLLTGDGKLLNGVIVLVNGVNIHFLQGFDTELGRDDTISIFPPLGGG